MVRGRRARDPRQSAPDLRGGTLRLVFAGTPAVALPPLRALLDSRHEVLAVITRPDAPSGRGRRLHASPVAELARERGLPVLTPRKPSEPQFQEQLRELAADCCPVVAYGALIPPSALQIPERGWVNLHFSLLPAWRGAAPVQHAVMAGDEITGATTFQLEKGMDTGPVYGVVTESIRSRDTAGDLLQRLSESGAGLLRATMDGIESGELIARPQPEDGVSIAPKVLPEDARVDWNSPAISIDRRIRGCTPDPGAWSTFRDQRLKLAPVVPVTGPRLAPGQIAAGRSEVLVGTASDPVRLEQVQPPGKRMMPALDWARGARPGTEERLQ